MKKKEELKNDKKEPKNNKNKFKKVIQEERKVEENVKKEEKFKNVIKKQYEKDYNFSYKKTLLEFQTNNDDVLNELNNLINNILSYNEILRKYSIELKKKIEDYIQYLNDINRKKFDPKNQNVLNDKQNYINSIKNVFKIYSENLFLIYNNKHLSNIRDLNEKLVHKMSYISELDFNPPNVNSFNNSLTKEDTDSYCYIDQFSEENNTKNILEDYEEFNDENISNDSNNSNYLKKSKKDININNNNNNNNLNDKKEKQIITFLDSMSKAIKYFLMCCNGILNKEKSPIKNNNIYESMVKCIKEFDLPSIKEYNFSSIRDFINNILDKQSDVNNLNVESFHITTIDYRIKDTFQNIFKDKKDELYKESFNEIENDFFSDDDEYQFQKNEDEFNKYCNNFYYTIGLFDKRKNILNNKYNFINCFLKNIKEKLYIKEKNIFLSFDNRKNFIENFIKTSEFFTSSIKEIKTNFTNFNRLYEYKIIYDNILQNYKNNILENNKEYLDYNGNTINPNSSFNFVRGTEKYDPPYGWFGIGLKVIDKYEDNDWLENKTNKSKWAIAYHGIGQFLIYNKAKEKLIDIVKNGLKVGGSQSFKDKDDKRNPGKKIGEGICLTPKINLAENFSGKILINNKRYKVVLMAKVLIEKIREPDDIDYWILNKEYIRIYRILVKEIKK